MGDELPLSKSAAIACATWLWTNFGPQLQAAAAGKPYQTKHLCGIVCQESAFKWLAWIGDHSVADIVARCVFDASGDYPGTSRSAFPKNTAAFRAKYGDVFTDMLVAEGNKTRAWQGWHDVPWLYKGYGIFQYDLQAVASDRAFFENREWYDFQQCLKRCCDELDHKLAAHGGDLWAAVKAYNGSGPKADQYAHNVQQFSVYCGTVTGEA